MDPFASQLPRERGGPFGSGVIPTIIPSMLVILGSCFGIADAGIYDILQYLEL